MFCFTDPAEPERDVLVTGLGLVTPLAVGRDESWRRLLAGERAGCSPIHFDAAGFDSGTDDRLRRLLRRDAGGAPVDHIVVSQLLQDQLRTFAPTNALLAGQRQDRLISMMLVAAVEACNHAGVRSLLPGNVRAAVAIGTSKSSLAAMKREVLLLRDRPASPEDADGKHWAAAFRSDAPLQAVRQVTGTAGPASCPVAACATGLVSVIQAADWIHAGLCDVCIAGSVDASLTPAVLASFHRLGILSRHDDVATACRPFAANRDGFIIGEGSAAVVLESRRHAEARRANSYGRLISGGWLSDPTGLTQIDTSGTVVAELLRRLMNAAGDECEIDHINLHGTGTEANDLAEARGVRTVFGSHAPVCSAIKGSIGHLLGGAGSVEFAMTLLSLRDQLLPPGVNSQDRDERCDISLTGEHAVAHRMTRVAKLSLGFGGHVAGCIVER